MTKTTYFEKSTDFILTEEEFMERLQKGDRDIAHETECLECGKVFKAWEGCNCSYGEDDSEW